MSSKSVTEFDTEVVERMLLKDNRYGLPYAGLIFNFGFLHIT
jgi:hypothetical protein